MHDITFVNEIFSVLKKRLAGDALANALSVNVKLSPFSHVTKEGLLNTYRELAKGSGFEHVRLNIEPLGQLLHCRNCKNNSTLTRPAVQCPHCRSQDIEIKLDKEFIVDSIEINKQG